MSGVPWLLVDITVFRTRPARAFSGIVRGVLSQEGSSYKGVAADSASVDQVCLLQSFPNGLFRFFREPISCFPLGANTTTVNISAQSDGETSVLGRLVILMDVPLLLMLSGSSLLEVSGIKSGFDFPCSSLLSLPLLRLNFHIIVYFCLSEIQRCPPTNDDQPLIHNVLLDQYPFCAVFMLSHYASYWVRGGKVGSQSTPKVPCEVDAMYDHIRLQLLGTLAFFFFYSFFLLLSEGNSIKAQILLGIHLKWEMYSFAMENVNAYKGRIAWWTPIWSLPSFNKYLISRLVSSSPLSTTVLEWNYFQANIDIVLE